MNGLVMQQPLLISSLLVHAERHHGDQEVVSRRVEGDIHRTTYRELAVRSRKMAKALAGLGVRAGDRVATLAWNGYRHLELYYAVSGSGAVLHTLNPRLHPDQVVYIADHAEDQVLFFDLTFLPLIEAIAGRVKTIRHFVAMTDRAHMPASPKVANLLCYEDLLEPHDDRLEWPTFDEAAASSLCYTSGTTGNPKGVLYSHRSTVLHAYAGCMPDVLGLSGRDSVLAVVPMFHANAWGLPYNAPMTGAALVLPGPKMADPATLTDLIESENVTMAAGVPTVWTGLLAYLEQSGRRIPSLERTVVGGSAVPLKMIREFAEQHGVTVLQGWGMTEMSPLGTTTRFNKGERQLPDAERFAITAKAGRPVFGCEMKIIDDAGNDLPQDGSISGNLVVRGPWIVSGYMKGDGRSQFLEDDWFMTGDVCKIEPDGSVVITDRSKDVIKSGGEWISSIDLENAAVGCEGVAEAAAIGIPHPKWDERPLLVCVRAPGSEVCAATIRNHLTAHVAKWWLPDAIEFLDELPHTATGKLSKKTLRDQFRDYRFANAQDMVGRD